MTWLIKIVRALYKYLLPGYKKMSLYSKVKELRDELLENCRYAVFCLKTVEANKDALGMSPTREDSTKITSSPTLSSYSASDTNDTNVVHNYNPNDPQNTTYKLEDEILYSFMTLTHGVLIQDWEHFLYDIFVEGVIYYLKGYNLSDSIYKLRLKNLKPSTELAEMRENLSAEVRASSRGYKDLFKQTRILFNVKKSKLLKEMQKQAQIRHIFQHSKGIIRRKDLSEIGSNGPDASFEILNDKKKLETYKEGQKILLSLPEIQKLYTVIKEYSEAFQKQAEKAKPAKAV